MNVPGFTVIEIGGPLHSRLFTSTVSDKSLQNIEVTLFYSPCLVVSIDVVTLALPLVLPSVRVHGPLLSAEFIRQ